MKKYWMTENILTLHAITWTKTDIITVHLSIHTAELNPKCVGIVADSE